MIKEIGNYLKSLFHSIFNEWKQRLMMRMINKSVIIAADAVSFICFLIAYIFLMAGMSMWIGQHFETRGLGYIMIGGFQFLIALISRPYIILFLKKRYTKMFMPPQEKKQESVDR